MDWERIKTLLIISLLLTNAVLGFFVVSDYIDNKSNSITKEEVIEYMNSIGINIKTDIPEEEQEIRSLYVVFDNYDIDQIKGDFLTNVIPLNDGNGYTDGTFTIKTENYNKIFIYEESDKTFEGTNITKDEAIKISNEFIDKHDFNEDKLFVSDVYDIGDGFQILYSQMINDSLIDGTYMKVIVNSDRVTYFERKWVHSIEDKGKKGRQKDTASLLFDVALDIKEANYDSEETFDIIDVNISYNIIDTEIFDSSINEGEIYPYFKFTLNNGDIYNIKAFEE